MDMNINILSDSEVQTLNEIIENAQNIVICCHKSPDGDALGSSLGWANFLTVCGKSPTTLCPTPIPTSCSGCRAPTPSCVTTNISNKPQLYCRTPTSCSVSTSTAATV